MNAAPTILVPESTGEIWAVVAHQSGSWTEIPVLGSSFPAAWAMPRNGVRLPLIPRYFPRPFSSYEELVETVRTRCAVDLEFRNRWRGWHLAGARVDGQVSPP